VRRYNGPHSIFVAGSLAVASSLAVDESGNVYVTSNSDGIAAVKYTSTGNEEWVSHYGFKYSVYACGIRVDKTGNVYVGGSSYADTDNSLFYTTIKYVQTPTSVEERNTSVPSTFCLSQNYPNPFNPSTVISYQLPVMSKVMLKIYDLLGREVATLVNEEQSAGKYNYELGIRNYELSSGIYFYRLQAGDFIETRKMLVIK